MCFIIYSFIIFGLTTWEYSMNVYICLPNDGEFEFEADLSYSEGVPAKLDGLPENCYPGEPAEAEFLNYGPFDSMFTAVYVACMVNECPMSIDEMEKLAKKVEEDTIQKMIDSPPEYEPDFEPWDDD